MSQYLFGNFFTAAEEKLNTSEESEESGSLMMELAKNEIGEPSANY